MNIFVNFDSNFAHSFLFLLLFQLFIFFIVRFVISRFIAVFVVGFLLCSFCRFNVNLLFLNFNLKTRSIFQLKNIVQKFEKSKLTLKLKAFKNYLYSIKQSIQKSNTFKLPLCLDEFSFFPCNFHGNFILFLFSKNRYRFSFSFFFSLAPPAVFCQCIRFFFFPSN